LCSSGTTGSPKGVCKSHSQIIVQLAKMWDVKSVEQEVMFNYSTLHWLSGFFFLMIGTLYGAKRVITTEFFIADSFLNIVDRFKVSTFLAPPSSITILLQSKNLKPMESIEILMAGGSVVSKSLSDSIKPFIPNGNIYVLYGSTEVDFLTTSFKSQRYGSTGKASFNAEIKIIDDDGRKLGPNQTGEICSKTPITFSGYFDDPEKTKECFDADGWIYSGDIGYFDDDGFLFIVDRKKDMLKFNNFQVCPSELEEMIDGIEGVISSCVVGVLDQNTGNDLIFAFVIKNSSNKKLTEEKILNHVQEKVIDAKKLRGGVHFVESFPLTSTGKIQKSEVKNMAQKFMFENQ
jgi:4-coumarate--CoA ligase